MIRRSSRNATRPRLRPVEGNDHERHASWLELFFDLIFVLVVSQVARLLFQDGSPLGFLRFTLLFAPLWWAWVGYTFYASRFEIDRDIIYRLVMMGAMLCVGALAVNIGGAFSSDAGGTAFALSYIAVRLVLIGLYVRARNHVHLARALANRYLIGFGIGAIFWIASLFVDAPARYVLWGIGFLVELTTPLFNSRAIARTPFDISHIPERFGLFTIIVLGESLLAVITGVADTHWHPASAAAATLCFAIAVAIWWIYFDFVEANPIRQGGGMGQIYLYCHFPIAMAIVMMGVGTHHAIVEAGESSLHASTRWLICGGIALFLMSITAIRLASHRKTLVWPRVFFAAATLTLAAVGGAIGVLPTVGLALLFLVTEIVIESLRSSGVSHALNAVAAAPSSDEESTAATHAAGAKQCDHQDQIRDVTPSANGCEECLKLGEGWVELRLCLICGHVGCCETSKRKHAEKHFHQTGHPLIQSFESGGRWRWCYVDETYL